tara:strand:+ start:16108 stop:16563 length:456 start_codon:yes stop_codon:yes gene_type:complete
MESGFHVHKLEEHETKDTKDFHVNGKLTVIWRDWDKIINSPEMVYVNSVNPHEIKGPHLHKNRTSYFFCLEGEIVVVIKDNDGTIHEIHTSQSQPVLIEISNRVPAAIVNPMKETVAKVLVLADVSWKPNDNEMENVEFTDYDWEKLIRED